MINSYYVTDAKLCMKVYELNQKGYTVFKTNLLDGRIHELFVHKNLNHKLGKYEKVN